jgi:endonuclease YncB( thermonuclease family)
MRRALALLLLAFAGVAFAQPDPTRRPHAGEEGVFDGSLLWVTDGDSLRIMIRGRDTEVRLADVDAPEREQPYGWNAKLQLIDLLRDKPLLVVPRDVDQYGRTVGWVWAGDVAINREMVARGSAWFYSKYADDDAFRYIEKEARDAKRGLWALPVKDRKEPWAWRREQSQGGRERE